jgi:predicted permease
MLVDTDLKKAGYSADQIPAMQKRMIDAMQTIPGVTSVGLVGQDPPLHMGWSDADIYAGDASDLRPSNAAGHAMLYSVSPEYFQAAGTTLISGRTFTWHDDKNSPLVAVVNERFARKLFGSPANALGNYFKRHDGTRTQVVGVVEDGKYTANLAEEPQLATFFPLLQVPSHETWLVLRSNTDPQQLAAAARSTLRQLDPGLPAFVQTWGTEMNGALFAPRLAALSLGVLGLMGAILSITGIFGMAAYSVSKRLRELGIRVALGAQRREILQSALGRAARLLAIGSGTGLVVGLLATKVLAAVVYQATPRDPIVLFCVVLAMSLLGLLATWIPARRALSIDPVSLLREE